MRGKERSKRKDLGTRYTLLKPKGSLPFAERLVVWTRVHEPQLPASNYQRDLLLGLPQPFDDSGYDSLALAGAKTKNPRPPQAPA